MKHRCVAPLAVAGLLLSCGPPEAPPPPGLEVEYGGCWSFSLPGPVCALWPGPDPKLKLWVRTDPNGKVEIRAGGRLLEGAGDEVSSGWRYRLSIPPKARLLTVSVVPRDGGRGASWSLRLAEPAVPAWLDEISKLEGDALRRRLLQLRQSAPGDEQGLVLRSLAVLAQREGDKEQEVMYLLQGRSAYRAEKRFSGEVEMAARLAGIYTDDGRFDEAQRTLEALRIPRQAPANAKYLLAFYHGLLSDAVGDYRSALEQLRNAASLAEQVGMTSYQWDAEQVLARVFQDLGRSQKASELFTRLRANPHPSNPCDLGSLLTNAGWARLKAREAGEDAEDPTPVLEEARAQFDLHPCPPEKRLNARLNLALAHQQAGRWSEARRALSQAQALAVAPNLRDRLWWDDLEARMAISEGHPERALSIYDRLGRTAERAGSLEGNLRALLGKANARLALGQRTEAIAALAEADRSIDEQSWLIPAHEGRDTFVAQREAVTRLYLGLLLAEGRNDEAFALARRARSRLLRQLTVDDRLAQLKPAEQRRWDEALSRYRTLRDAIDRQAAEEWQLAGDQVERAHQEQMERLATARDDLERALSALGDPGRRGGAALSPPGPSEVILAYHPLGNKRWVGFAATKGGERGIETSTFDLPDEALAAPSRLAGLLLAPFSSAIRSAERVRMLPYGPLWSVDFHALPFDGEPLLAKHVVVYSLDLPVRSTLAPTARPTALIVSDPSDDLPAAHDEAAAVSGAVCAAASGWSCMRLDGEEAGAEAVREKLPGAGLFHYAGHGNFAGFGGWGSVLPLAGGSRLTLGDVLALRRAPDQVVLSACDAARSSEQAPGEGIGLANAFLLAGSRAVIAARSPVEDRSARDLMQELYRGWRPGEDLARQLQRTQVAARLKDKSPGAAWALFRILVP